MLGAAYENARAASLAWKASSCASMTARIALASLEGTSACSAVDVVSAKHPSQMRMQSNKSALARERVITVPPRLVELDERCDPRGLPVESLVRDFADLDRDPFLG